MGSLEKVTADVCVIGGGPAGSTTAKRLADLGYDVCLVERQAFPRRRIAASLPSAILPLLDALGVRERIDNAGFPRPRRLVVWWSEAFPSIRLISGPPGYNVDRGLFDQLLLQNAEASGVAVLRSAHATHPERLTGGGWKIRIRHAGVLKEITATFLVDASGGGTFLPGRRPRISAPLLSLFAHWQSDDNGESDGRIEASEAEWFWYAPLGRGKSVAAVFVDPKRLSSSSQDGIDTFYCDLLQRFRLFRELKAGRIEGEVKACDASSRYAEQPVGSDFVRVGDANFSLDPLSSQGILNAIVSGLQAAIFINTLAKDGANAEAAMDFYKECQSEKITRYAAKTAAFYQERAAVCDQPFWKRRATFNVVEARPPFETKGLEPTCRIKLSDLAKIENVPTIQGNTIALAPAVCHEALHRPVAFLGDLELVPMLRQIRSGQTADSLVQAWSRCMAADLSWTVLRWLWDRRIIVPIMDSDPTKSAE